MPTDHMPRDLPLLDDLGRAMRRHMLTALPAARTVVLRDADLRRLQSIYATWRGRVPATVPRTVHLSAELLANPERGTYSDGLSAVVREVSRGADLRPRMSTSIDHAYAVAPPPLLARRHSERHHDRLLADWGIHHLHLSTARHPRRPEFLGRTPHVLLVAFVRTDAYMIDLRSHESDGANWSELAILRTVVRNWPDAGILLSSDWLVGLSHGNWSDEDRRVLRQAGVSTGAVEIDGRVWSAGGQSLAGTPSHVERHCMATSWFLSGYEPTEDGLRTTLRAQADEHDVPDEWRGHVSGHDDYGFTSGRLFVRFGSLLPRSGSSEPGALGSSRHPVRASTSKRQ